MYHIQKNYFYSFHKINFIISIRIINKNFISGIHITVKSYVLTLRYYKMKVNAVINLFCTTPYLCACVCVYYMNTVCIYMISGINIFFAVNPRYQLQKRRKHVNKIGSKALNVTETIVHVVKTSLSF